MHASTIMTPLTTALANYVNYGGRLGCLLLGLAVGGSASLALASEPEPEHEHKHKYKHEAVELELHGCYQSDYATRVQLGDGNYYNLLVDTGSMALAVAANDCGDCQSISPRYVPSTAAENDHNTIEGFYGGGNGWVGAVYTDVVSLPHLHSDVQLEIAAIDYQTTNTSTTTAFFNDAYCSGSAVANTQQGIMGLAPTNLGPAGVDSFADQIAHTGKYADIFSFQFCDIDGKMWWGGYDHDRTTQEPAYTPMNFSSGFYLVQMLDIEVNGASIGANANNYGDTLADTGTSIMLVPTPVFSALNTAIESNATYQKIFGTGFLASGACQTLPEGTTRDDIDAQLPAMSLVFAGNDGKPPIKVQVPPTSSYLLAQHINPAKEVAFCVGVAPVDLAPLQAIVGNSIMHSQITIFDRAHHRLGFAPSKDCKRI